MSSTTYSQHQRQQQYYNSDVITLGDLVSEYDVIVGQRPDMEQIVTQVHQEFSRGLRITRASQRLEGKIGIFISGPEALKSATERVVSELGAHDFDIHEEEFEL